MWYFLYAIERSNIVKSINAWGETAVEAEDLVVDQGGKGEIIEEIGEVFPYIRVTVLSETFVVEAVNLSDLAGLVITTKNCDALRISDLECNEEGDGFDGIIASINVITYIRWSVLRWSCADMRGNVPMKR